MLTISVFYIRYTPAVMKWRFIMLNEIQPKNKLLIVGAGLLFFAMVFPSFFLLAKIAIGLAMIDPLKVVNCIRLRPYQSN